jgi:DNA-binding SARP family transcriptional activator
MDTERLRGIASLFVGDFLEDLELSDFQDFQGWCVAEREELRRGHLALLHELCLRPTPPEQRISDLKAWLVADPLDEHARRLLMEQLTELGRRKEAEQQYEAAKRLADDLGGTVSLELVQTLKKARDPSNRVEPSPAPSVAPEASAEVVVSPARGSLSMRNL